MIGLPNPAFDSNRATNARDSHFTGVLGVNRELVALCGETGVADCFRTNDGTAWRKYNRAGIGGISNDGTLANKSGV